MTGPADVQGALWGAAARDWADLAEPLQIPLFEAALAALEMGAGTRLLDAGCGAGLALALAAQRGATIAGLDASAALLEIARERLPDADLRQGDLEALPYADAAFDAVTAFNSVQYAGNPAAALREIRRVVKPGARVAVATWGRPEQCEMRAVLSAVDSLLPAPRAGTGGPFALADSGALEALVESAGLMPETAIDVPTPYAHPDLDSAVRARLASGPAQRAIQSVGFAATQQAIARACEASRRPDGSVTFANVFKVLIARA